MPNRFRSMLPAALLPLLWGCVGEAAGNASGPGAGSESAAPGSAARVSYDLLIHGGRVVDGSGSPARGADVLVLDGRIAHVGVVDPDTVEARTRYDAASRVVAPGFIDLHAHGEPLQTPAFENFIAMGVTTIVLGLDGTSPRASELAGHLAAVERVAPAVNVAYLIGHNTIRQESGVGFGSAGAVGRERMAALVGRAMDAGAFGLSLGLEYDPGVRADLDELVAIARAVAQRGGVVMSHMRSEDSGRVGASLDELLAIGRRSGAHVHASHLKIVLGSDTTEALSLLRAMDAARAEGLTVTGDLYPYTASFTGLSILFPEWARPPHDYRQVARERRAELAEHLRQRVNARNGPGATLFGSGRFSGMTLEEAARREGRPFEEVLIDLGPGGARAAYFVMDESVMRALLRDPHVTVATDGSPQLAHPRGYGSFPRVIRRYVVEQPVFPLEEAVRKMSGLPASILGLDRTDGAEPRRGLIREGWAADLVVFEPAEIEDVADFEQPHRLSRGVGAAWVNGEEALRDGRPSGTAGTRSGRVLTRR
jgi:N-acyl-D-amino-acid deacylase